jgi:hypothetical protein
MTKQINDWRTRIILFLEKRREKEKLRELQKAKASILYYLTTTLTTEESIKMSKEVDKEHRELMTARLESISKEKIILEEFLN